jgi:tetratricopeptide (TPR) repeat protein/2-polyprenyl-3-methyl-5-hydroxy-6-metoxy-1,4-benzoquinol methylase
MQPMANTGIPAGGNNGDFNLTAVGSSSVVASSNKESARRGATISGVILAAVPGAAVDILEIGCGAGILGGELKRMEVRRHVTGIEIDETASRLAQNVIDRVFCINVEQFEPPFKPGEFDCLLFSGVLEHLVDPWAIAKRYVTFLKPQGTLIASVSNLRCLDVLSALVEGGAWTYQQEGILNGSHLRFFTRKEVFRLMETIEIRVDAVQYLSGGDRCGSPPVWTENTLTCGNFSLANVRADESAEFHATRLLFIGTFQPTPVSPTEAPVAHAHFYSNALQLAADGRIESAIRALECLLALQPGHAAAHHELGVLHYQRKNLGKALFYHEKAVEIDPNSQDFLKDLAKLYYTGMGRGEDAQRLYCRILTAWPNDFEAIERMAAICLSLDQRQAAQRLYSRLLRLAPDHHKAQTWRHALRESRDSAIASTPEGDYHQATMLVAAGLDEDAIALLEARADSRPDRAIFHNDLGVLYTQMENLTKAREHYELAVKLNPGNTTFLKNLGDFYLAKLGMVEEFIKLYLTALQLEPRDAEALLMLGNIYSQLNLQAEAESFYRKAKMIDPGNVHAVEGLERLRHAR